MPRLTPLLTALGAAMFLATAAAPADAAPRHRSGSVVQVKAKKATAKPTKKKATAARSKRKGKAKKRGPARLSNMPKGWSWPPSRSMESEGKRCLGELDKLGIAWKKAKRVGKIVTPITVADLTFGGVKLTPTYQRGPFTIDCHLALGLSTYLPKVAAFGVTEVKFSRIYGYTRVRTGGRQRNALSRHALGLAVDIRSFVKADGTEVSVFTDYKLGNTDLLGIERALNDSGGFRTVLTPGNDPKSHYDHYHVEVKVEYPTARRASS